MQRRPNSSALFTRTSGFIAEMLWNLALVFCCQISYIWSISQGRYKVIVPGWNYPKGNGVLVLWYRRGVIRFKRKLNSTHTHIHTHTHTMGPWGLSCQGFTWPVVNISVWGCRCLSGHFRWVCSAEEWWRSLLPLYASTSVTIKWASLICLWFTEVLGNIAKPLQHFNSLQKTCISKSKATLQETIPSSSVPQILRRFSVNI